MRHRVKGRKLSRTTPHRQATLRALSSALIKEHRIQTTVSKAKELRRFIEPLITTAKEDTHHNRRKVFSSLQDKYAVAELFETVGPAAADRPGGYTRVLKLGFRSGDSAEMAVIELVDFNDVPPEKRSGKKKRTRRAGRSNKPTSADPEKPAESKADTKEEGTEKSEAVQAETQTKEERSSGADVTQAEESSTTDQKKAKEATAASEQTGTDTPDDAKKDTDSASSDDSNEPKASSDADTDKEESDEEEDKKKS